MDWKKQMNDAMTYIEEHIHEKINYQALAHYMCCSENEFRRMFSFLTQIPLSEYIRNRKLTKAAEALLSGEKVIDVAYAFGYDSPAAFSRAFKQKHGMAPSKIQSIDPYPPYEFRMILVEGLQVMNGDYNANIVGSGEVGYAFKTEKDNQKIKQLNNAFWSNRGNDLIGTTALPKYSAFLSEEKIRLFDDLLNKKVLEVGCGSGQSLAYIGSHQARELWGIDISKQQIEKTKHHLDKLGYKSHLIETSMEAFKDVPMSYFDVIYSVYGIGWTTDLDLTFRNIYNALKDNGYFIFSWSHPIHKCVSLDHGQLIFRKNYFDEAPYEAKIDGETYSLADRKLSTYINSLAKAGFIIESLIEESDEMMIESYGKAFGEKAKMLPVAFVIKAKKIINY